MKPEFLISRSLSLSDCEKLNKINSLVNSQILLDTGFELPKYKVNDVFLNTKEFIEELFQENSK